MKNILFIALVACAGICHAQVYNHPIKPGTADWKKFNTHQEMVTASQLPTSYIQQAKTIDLIQSFFNYPLLLDMYAYNNPYNGFKEMSSQFNGLEALQVRADAPQIILEEYQKVNFNALPANELAIGKLILVTAAFELLISTETLLQKFSKKQQKEILKVLLTKIETKQVNKTVFGEMGIYTALFAASKIMGQLQDATWLAYVNGKPKTKQFTVNMQVEDDKIADEIITHVKRILQ
jgi:hypothetical protein